MSTSRESGLTNVISSSVKGSTLGWAVNVLVVISDA